MIQQQKWFNIIVTNIREKVGGARGRENSSVPLYYRGLRGAYFIHWWESSLMMKLTRTSESRCLRKGVIRSRWLYYTAYPFYVRKGVPGRAENDVNSPVGDSTVLPESALARAWQWTSRCCEVSVLENWWLVSRSGSANIHVETLRELGKRTLSSSIPQIHRILSSAHELCLVLQEMEPELQLESVSREPRETLGNDDGKWLFLQPEQITEMTDLMTVSTFNSLWIISGSFKEQVITIIVIRGKMFFENDKPEVACPTSFFSGHYRSSHPGGS